MKSQRLFGMHLTLEGSSGGSIIERWRLSIASPICRIRCAVNQTSPLTAIVVSLMEGRHVRYRSDNWKSTGTVLLAVTVTSFITS